MIASISLDKANLDRLVQNLGQFALEYGHSGPVGDYVLFKNSLITRREVDRDAGLMMKIMNHHRQLVSVSLPFTASRIDAHRNVRIFGFNGRKEVTVKVLMQQATRSLFREIRARRMVSSIIKSAGPITVPRLLAHDRKGGNWLVEEFVKGVHAGPMDTALLVMTGEAGTYGRASRLRPLRRLIDAASLVDRLVELDPLFPRVALDAKWPVSLTHGDLVPTNILRMPDGRFCVIDWELAAIKPVAFDLAYFYRHSPNLKAAILDFIGRLDPNGEAMPAAIQLAFGVVHLAREVWQDRAAYIRNLRQHNKLSFAQAMDRVDEDLRGVKEYLAFLRTP